MYELHMCDTHDTNSLNLWFTTLLAFSLEFS